MTDAANRDNEDIRQPLLGEFTTANLDQWRAEAERLLRGAPFAKKMFTRILEDITVGPLYTAADTADLPWRETGPGQPPYLRGASAGGYKAAPWLVAQELRYPTAAEFNGALLHDLQRGQSAVNLILDEAGLAGLDPDQAPAALVGQGGTSLASVADLGEALAGVDLTRTPIICQAGLGAFPLLAMLRALLERQGHEPAVLRGCIGADPIYGLARISTLPLSLDRIYDELAVTTHWAADNAPGLRTLPVWEAPWHDGGADGVLGLGLVLAGAVHHLRQLEQRGVDVETAQAHVYFNLSIGSDFFLEIARLRALRMLWHRVTTGCGCPEGSGKAYIHARTSARNQTVLDPYVNMLRATTEAMSAVFGGVDSLHVGPFDEVDGLPGEFSRRIARNVQLILAEECHFDQVIDPAGGSWYVEKLTDEVAAGAWAVLQEIEAAGGIVAALQQGLIQERVAAAAGRRAERLALRRDVLVGNNCYVNPAEPKRTRAVLDHAALAAARTEEIRRQRTAQDGASSTDVLDGLESLLGADRDQWLERMTTAAARGATLGELVGLLRHDAEAGLEVEPIPKRRDAVPFENLRSLVAEVGKADAALSRVFCACLGDFARYMPRLDFVRGFFQVGGFDVVGDRFFDTAADAVVAAAADGASTVVLVGLDATYTELAAETASGLGALARPPRIILAGQPEQQLRDELIRAGIKDFIHLRSNVLEVLVRVATGDEGVQEVRS